MAIDKKGKRYDGRPKAPAIPPHMRRDLGPAQKKAFAASDRITGDRKKPAKRAGREKAKRTAKKASPAPAAAETPKE